MKLDPTPLLKIEPEVIQDSLLGELRSPHTRTDYTLCQQMLSEHFLQ